MSAASTVHPTAGVNAIYADATAVFLFSVDEGEDMSYECGVWVRYDQDVSAWARLRGIFFLLFFLFCFGFGSGRWYYAGGSSSSVVRRLRVRALSGALAEARHTLITFLSPRPNGRWRELSDLSSDDQSRALPARHEHGTFPFCGCMTNTCSPSLLAYSSDYRDVPADLLVLSLSSPRNDTSWHCEHS